MILQLLSLFKTSPLPYCHLSTTGRNNQIIKTSLSFYYADRAIMILTLGWVGFMLYGYGNVYHRPHELFAPMHYFGALFLPSIPSPGLYYSIGTATLLLTLSTIFYKDHYLIRIILTFFLLWIYAAKWSFGFQSHAAHLFLLTHLFRVFIPYKIIWTDSINLNIYKSIQWVLLGVLITYFYSGMWKWIGVGYKILTKPADVHWLKAEGPLYNAIIEYRQIDLPLDHAWVFEHVWFWQISFVLMSFILTFSIFAAFRHPLKIWVGLALIVFHLVNSLAFNINFYTAMTTLLLLFFPYDLFFNKIKGSLDRIQNTTFEGNRLNAQYTRVYENNDQDIFKGYYAYREFHYDKNPLVGGLFYTPFLAVTVTFIWNLFNKRKR